MNKRSPYTIIVDFYFNMKRSRIYFEISDACDLSLGKKDDF